MLYNNNNFLSIEKIICQDQKKIHGLAKIVSNIETWNILALQKAIIPNLTWSYFFLPNLTYPKEGLSKVSIKKFNIVLFTINNWQKPNIKLDCLQCLIKTYLVCGKSNDVHGLICFQESLVTFIADLYTKGRIKSFKTKRIDQDQNRNCTAMFKNVRIFLIVDDMNCLTT